MHSLRLSLALVSALAADTANAPISLNSFIVDPEGNRIELIQPAQR